MRKYFLILFTIICCSILLNAQENFDTVYLINGDVVYGQIVAHTPNKFLKIKTQNGNTYIYLTSEIYKINEQELRRETHIRERISDYDNNYDPNIESKNSKKYRSFLDFGYSFGVGKYKFDRLELLTSYGYQSDPNCYIGVGIGLNYYFTDTSVSIPLFLNTFFLLSSIRNNVSPFLDFKVGYTATGNAKGFYFAPDFGLRFNKKAINMRIGYTYQNAKVFFNGPGLYVSKEKRVNIGALTLKFGCDF